MIAAEFYKIALLTRKLNLSYIHELYEGKVIKIGTKSIKGKNTQVLRVYSGQNKNQRKEFRLNSRNAEVWKDILNDQQQRADMEINLKFRNELEHIDLNLPSLKRQAQDEFSKEVFDKLIERRDPDIKKGHIYDGHCFRSKSEVIIAQVLKSLGMEYKYEVILTVGNKTYYADFAVYCHETSRFFYIEHFGMMADEDYRYHTIQKISAYSRSGLIEGLDILYTFETSNGTFYTEMLKSKILGVVIAQVESMCRQ